LHEIKKTFFRNLFVSRTKPQVAMKNPVLEPIQNAGANGSHPATPGLASEIAGRIARSIAYMVQHLDEPLQISTLAAQASVSQSHFFALFKRQTGTAPIDYFIRLRMNHARQLLDSTCSSVKEIAATMGYDDPFYFSRVFKSVHRVAPAEYRRRNGQARPGGNRSLGPLAISVRPATKPQNRISFD
jgi:transcriptional regulator GlxA family with amidase domain